MEHVRTFPSLKDKLLPLIWPEYEL